MERAQSTRHSDSASGHDTGAALLEAASRLMTQQNTVDISISQIAKEAGKNSALIKYHFGNKDGLLFALLQRDFEPGLQELDRLGRAQMNAADKLRAHIDYSVHGMATVPYIYRLLHALLRDSEADVARQVTEQITKPVANFYADLIVQGCAEGRFHQINPMVFFAQLSGALDLFFSARATWRYGFGVEGFSAQLLQEFADQLSDTLLNGISQNQPNPIGGIEA